MFDSIGRNLDEAGPARSAKSAALSLALLAAAFPLLLATATQATSRLEQAYSLAPMELVLLEDDGADALTAPEPPRGVPDGDAAPGAAPAAPSAPAADPEQPTDAAAPEAPAPATPPSSAVETPGTAAPGPTPRGLADGISGLLGRSTRTAAEAAPAPSDAPSVGAGTATAQPGKDVRWRRMDEPDWPTFARGYAVGAEEACAATVSLNTIGEPDLVEVSGCPKIFADETRRTLQTWRAWPAEENGQPIRRRTAVIVRFRQL